MFSLAFAIDGGVIIESIFSWPGMGQTLVAAAVSEDLPLAVGAFVFVGIFVLVAHLGSGRSVCVSGPEDTILSAMQNAPDPALHPELQTPDSIWKARLCAGHARL